jgi:DNA-binding response OmpR family regulator
MIWASELLTLAELQEVDRRQRQACGGVMNERVLIVDDNEDVRRILALRFAQAGFEVHDAANGRAGLDELRRGNWDLVLLDLVMPELDGFEFLAALRGEAAAAPPVVVITQYDDTIYRQRALALGAAQYVGKTSAFERTFPGAVRNWVRELRLQRGAPTPGN